MWQYDAVLMLVGMELKILTFPEFTVLPSIFSNIPALCFYNSCGYCFRCGQYMSRTRPRLYGEEMHKSNSSHSVSSLWPRCKWDQSAPHICLWANEARIIFQKPHRLEFVHLFTK